MNLDLSLKPVQLRRTCIPYFVLTVALLFTAAVTYQVAKTTEEKDSLQFENAVGRTRDNIENRVETYIALLRSSSGLFAGSDKVERNEFRAFVERAELQQRFPGVRGIGFATRVTPSQKNALVADMQRQGVKNFAIRPNSNQTEYYPIVYLEPLDRRNQTAIGYDMFSEPVRRAAMELARDKGTLAASGRVTLVQEIDKQKQAGFLIYIPVYRNGATLKNVSQRRVALQGFIYSPFRTDDLMVGIFGTEKHPIIDFEIYDSTNLISENLLYSSERQPILKSFRQPRFTTTTTINVAGRPWTIFFASRPQFELNSGRRWMPFIALGGLTFGLVLFGVTRSQVSARIAAEQATEALRRSEIRFRTLIEQSPLSTQIMLPDGRTLQVNQAWEKLWGVEVQRLGDYNILKDRQLIEKGIMPYIQKGFAGEATAIPPVSYNPNETIANITIREDPRRWVQAHIYPVKDEAGNIREVVLLHEDITERKQAEEAWSRSEERFRRLFDSNTIAIAFWNVEGFVTDANDAYLNIAGYTREEFIANGINWRQLTPPEYKQLDDRAVEQCMARGAADVYEKEYVQRDGARVSIIIGIALLNQSQHDGIAFILDITARKKAEAALKESEKRFRKLTEKVRVIPWEADAITGKFTYVGPQTVEILGYPVEEWYADNFWLEHIYSEDREWAINYCIDSSFKLDNYEFEYRMLAADGQVVWLHDLVSVVRGKTRPKLLRGIMIDITERKRIEAERLQLLEREKAARTQAEAANRMKDEFLATLSHELRTPLNSMVGWTNLLRTRKFDEATTARALETIDRNTKSLAQLIEDLLDVSRIMTGKLHLEMRPVKLASIIHAAIEAVQPTATAKNIQIYRFIDSSVGLVLGDSTRLQQIIWNLLTNAIKFTPQTGKVEVSLERDADNVKITVSDTGQGISADFLPYIFERFRQADASTTRKHGGLGIGLAIVRNLVQLHGGSIYVESQGEGQGAKFIVKLPLFQSSKDSSELTDNTSDKSVTKSAAKFTYLPLSGLQILVVDDEADARELLKTVLEESGAEVKAVGSAKAAFELISKNYADSKSDILISDIGMPDEDGYSLIRKIRTLPPAEGGRIPAVALTAYAREEERSQAISAGFQIHLAKPVEAEKLIKIVATLAGRMEDRGSS